MKKMLLLICCCMTFLTGCLYQGKYRPNGNPDEIWVCENPYIEYYFTDDGRNIGKLIYNGTEYDIAYASDFGPWMGIYTPEIYLTKDWDEKQKYKLLDGEANYKKNSFTFTVQKDVKNIFGGELPVMEFVKHNKKEYFKNKKADK